MFARKKRGGHKAKRSAKNDRTGKYKRQANRTADNKERQAKARARWLERRSE